MIKSPGHNVDFKHSALQRLKPVSMLSQFLTSFLQYINQPLQQQAIKQLRNVFFLFRGRLCVK